MPETIEHLVQQFPNGKERYMTDPLFRNVIMSLANGDKCNIIEQLLNIIKQQEEKIRGELYRKPIQLVIEQGETLEKFRQEWQRMIAKEENNPTKILPMEQEPIQQLPYEYLQRITNPKIERLKKNEIFTFGSNTEGKHISGAAATAKLKFGAEDGCNFGLMGSSFAIPTMDLETGRINKRHLKKYINEAIMLWKHFPKNKVILVTEIGCGIAGWRIQEVAPLFKEAINMENVKLPYKFWLELMKQGYLKQ